jgi:hypothetical protein
LVKMATVVIPLEHVFSRLEAVSSTLEGAGTTLEVLGPPLGAIMVSTLVAKTSTLEAM